MMRTIGKSLLVLATLVWAGTASAASISVVNAPAEAAPSDLVTVDVVMDGTGVTAIASMFFHVNWTANVSLVSRTYAAGLPGVFWSTLPGHGTVDANGLYTAQYDVTDTGGVFAPGTPIVSMVFHVVEPGAGTAVITPLFATGDAIGGGAADGYPDLTTSFTLNSATIITPEPTTAVLLGLGLFGIAYAGRRR